MTIPMKVTTLPDLPHDRVLGWESALTRFLMETRRRSLQEKVGFAWNPTVAAQNAADDVTFYSCLSLAGAVTKVLLGVDFYKRTMPGDFDGDNTPLAAFRELRSRGYNTIQELLAQLFEEIPLQYVQRGDLVLFKSRALETYLPENTPEEDISAYALGVGIADAPYMWGFVSEEFDRLPLSWAQSGFAIGARI